MAILTGYYNSLNGDRKYNAETMSSYYKGILTKGVLQNYKGKFVVTATSEMSVKIPTGKAYFSDGKFIENTADIIITLDPSEITLNRIDRIILRNDKNESVRNATVEYLKGTPATNPTPPALTNNDYVEELCLCEINVPKLAESITQANITNTIPNNSLCGYVTGLIYQVDTEDLYIQYQTDMNNYLNENKKTFDEWFKDIRDEVSSVTLMRQYSKDIITSVQDQTDIPITESNYNRALDILNVYVNGMLLSEGTQYENMNTYVRLKQPLDINQQVQIVIFKSVDGYNAETVVSEVEKLNDDVAKLMNHNYYCNSVNDNELLTELAQNFLNGVGEFAGVSETAEMKINVYGKPVGEATVKGNGSTDNPYVWFSLGKIGDSLNSERKITFDFTYADRISLGSADNLHCVVFDGNDVNIIGLNLVIGGNGSDLKWFNGNNVSVRDSQLYLNATKLAVGSSQGGFFERCRLSVTSVSGKATALNSNGTTILKVVDCEIYCYNGGGVTDESIAILGEASKTEGVVIVERCNIPLKSRGGYKQSQTIKINSGFCSIVSNTLGKAPLIYKPTDSSMVTNIGSMVISK